MNQTLNIPLGANAATVQILDAQGNDITSTCTITAQSADPTIVAVGTPTSPNVIPLTALKEGGSTTVSYTAVNSAGQIVETDTLNVVVTAPATINVTYAQTVVTPPAPAAAAAAAAPKQA
jgi:hypothetical protein